MTWLRLPRKNARWCLEMAVLSSILRAAPWVAAGRARLGDADSDAVLPEEGFLPLVSHLRTERVVGARERQRGGLEDRGPEPIPTGGLVRWAGAEAAPQGR